MEHIILLDPEKCVGCRQCSLSCSFIKEQIFSLGKARNTVLWVHRSEMFVPMRCQHCEEPLCMDVCPMEAISRNEETGAIVIDQDRCIGCKMCMVVCPFGAVTWDADSRSMIKCDLCDGDPECVKHCVYGALSWLPADEAAVIRRQAGAGVLAEALSKVKQA
jgi:carbon-monoxide dehydrogenase iron sulfur subunit